ncbi:MAG: hypothetical protein OHK0057_30790 [Thermoflexibacter sp.]
MNKMKLHLKADHLGVLSAGLCLIHCTLLPIVFAWKAISFEHEIEGSFKWDYVFLIFSFYAVLQASKNAISSAIKWTLWISFSILAVSVFLENYAKVFEYIIIFTSLFLIVVHLYNLRYRQAQTCCASHV